ncbi:hypothetical protein USDA257_c18120 [Sinorhizobium fredii USDA 257]|uniref:Uncharacterized protein n=1 Tax=Sinorhizobium fredii (strain USDA 257) TaxID=1185652 RepID=I3X3E3_SINF2|nr:hypothetical protein USDA257_c18020 [Sinorhizobium fredii USDA 257]AFL50399.1 hypothetical protein USDA257_c18120 [Sinorhizobium fredii USDA 257]
MQFDVLGTQPIGQHLSKPSVLLVKRDLSNRVDNRFRAHR